MSSYVQDEGGLVEPEGVNAGGPVDGGPSPAEPGGEERAGEQHPAGEPHPGRDVSGPELEGQGSGELLSGPGSDHGLTRRGPGQEMSAGEG